MCTLFCNEILSLRMRSNIGGASFPTPKYVKFLTFVIELSEQENQKVQLLGVQAPPHPHVCEISNICYRRVPNSKNELSQQENQKIQLL
jgi:hypothetical protein